MGESSDNGRNKNVDAIVGSATVGAIVGPIVVAIAEGPIVGAIIYVIRGRGAKAG